MLRRAYVPTDLRFSGTGTPLYISAPTGGLNTREAFQELAPNESRVLENFDPEGAGVKIRPGHSEHSTGADTGDVATMHVWAGATPVLMAASGGKIYNVTTSTAVELATGYTDNYWQAHYYNGWSFWVNGTDTPFRFDGTSTAATGFTGSGLTLSDLNNVTSIKNRLWFTENDSADVWYGGAAAVTSTLTKFQLSQIAQGGTCTAIGAWSRDGGDGPDDYNVFVMSTGEVLIYTGDPASTFSIVGRFVAPPPVGPGCLVQYGGALAIVTENGLIPLDAVVAGTAFDPHNNDLLFVGKTAPSMTNDFKLYGGNDGWAATFVAGKIYINVPATTMSSHQYVFNTRNGTWAKYTDLPVASFVEYQNELYFGGIGTGKILNLDKTQDDNGSDITARSHGAFVEPFQGRAGSYTAVRHRFTADSNLTGRFGFDLDYLTKPLSSTTVTILGSITATAWGSDWGSSWGGAGQAELAWFSSKGHGRAVAVNIEIYGSGGDTFFHGSDVMAKVGNYL